MVTEYAGGRSAVFEQYRRRLFAVAYRMTGTRADAEDMVQEASFETDGRSILALHNVLNPEKLKGIGRLGGTTDRGEGCHRDAPSSVFVLDVGRLRQRT